MSPAEGATALGKGSAPICRFVPEAMCDAGTSTLIAQQRCGTIRPEMRAFSLRSKTVPETLVCGAVGGHSSCTRPPIIAMSV
jgi:hypothetical protein